MTATELASVIIERLDEARRPHRPAEFLRAQANGNAVQNFLITVEEAD